MLKLISTKFCSNALEWFWAKQACNITIFYTNCIAQSFVKVCFNDLLVCLNREHKNKARLVVGRKRVVAKYWQEVGQGKYDCEEAGGPKAHLYLVGLAVPH